MAREVNLRGRRVGDGYPAFIIAEIGINHNGDVENAKRLIDAAAHAGADAVKFQKRTPELCVPVDQRDQMRETPWGYITYLEYRHRMEFGQQEFKAIDNYCKQRGMQWFASVWDEPSADFMQQFDPACYKVPSASLTDHGLLSHLRRTGGPLILSTGMSTLEQIQAAVGILGTEDLIITHATSSYPCEPEELNLRMIPVLRELFPCPVGYSGHEVGLVPSAVAVALGASVVERHITLDRALWGSDQAASVEPSGFERLVKYIRVAEQSLGDGVKRVYDSERPSLRKLRRFETEAS
ncbi:MAG: N-acetylneuraminate synthase family protein [Anaerolineales bacterium]|nr:N-acetylneuraminate synthase family protein [Anaerolineales bacterium]